MTLLKRRGDRNYKLRHIYCDNYVFNGLKSNHLKFGYILHHDFFLVDLNVIFTYTAWNSKLIVESSVSQ